MEDSPPSTAVPVDKQWRCDQCAATFTRLDHLKRHNTTHTAQRSHVCHFCGAQFSRGDVLRRHWKSCKTRLENGVEIPKGLRGGKHKRACDSCASIRKACNGESPCSECSHRERTCTYQRLYDVVDGTISSAQPDVDRDVDTDLLARDQASQKNLDMAENDVPWDLGLQNFYPSGMVSKVYSRHHFGT